MRFRCVHALDRVLVDGAALRVERRPVDPHADSGTHPDAGAHLSGPGDDPGPLRRHESR